VIREKLVPLRRPNIFLPVESFRHFVNAFVSACTKYRLRENEMWIPTHISPLRIRILLCIRHGYCVISCACHIDRHRRGSAIFATKKLQCRVNVFNNKALIIMSTREQTLLLKEVIFFMQWLLPYLILYFFHIVIFYNI